VDCERLGVLLLPSFNAMATMSLLDPFRAANYLAGEPRYQWQMLSLEAPPVVASNGTTLTDTFPFTAAVSTTLPKPRSQAKYLTVSPGNTTQIAKTRLCAVLSFTIGSSLRNRRRVTTGR
jgi:transcriptional regulator GlxA family with amidase domain